MSEAEELYNQKRYVFSLDEAIEHAKEAAECTARRAVRGEIACEKCAIEIYALYRWLVELQTLREAVDIAAKNWTWEDDEEDDEEVSDFLKGCNHGVNE